MSSAVKDGKIIKGVSCEGISIGGMTRSEAKDAIESHMKEIHQEKSLYEQCKDQVPVKSGAFMNRQDSGRSLCTWEKWKYFYKVAEI